MWDVVCRGDQFQCCSFEEFPKSHKRFFSDLLYRFWELIGFNLSIIVPPKSAFCKSCNVQQIRNETPQVLVEIFTVSFIDTAKEQTLAWRKSEVFEVEQQYIADEIASAVLNYFKRGFFLLFRWRLNSWQGEEVPGSFALFCLMQRWRH